MTSVVVLSLGGTIAMVAPEGGGPVVPALNAVDLLRSVPGLARLRVDLQMVDVRRVPGASLTTDDMREVVRLAQDYVDAGATGVVITQGTDTIEETAFVLDLLWDRDEPIVVTGAMRHGGQAGADGPANLLGAVTVANARFARAMGCLVALADEVHAARWVRKTHTTSVAAFASPSTGPVGRLVEGTVQWAWRPPDKAATIALEVNRPGVRVALVTATLGDDGFVIDRLRGDVNGLVVAGFGAGHLPESWVERLTTLAVEIPVVLASRIGTGPVLSSTYGFPGSESDLLSRGLISAGVLDAYKARIALLLLLESGVDRSGIAGSVAVIAKNLWDRLPDNVM